MLVVHATWFRSELRLWGEDPDRPGSLTHASDDNSDVQPHAHAASAERLADVASGALIPDEPLKLRLPSTEGRPTPSPMAAASGELQATEIRTFSAPSLVVPIERTEELFSRLRDGENSTLACGPSIEFFRLAARFARQVMAAQRYVPLLMQSSAGEFEGSWYPWLSDERSSRYAAELVRAMPISARAGAGGQAEAWGILEEFLSRTIDVFSREALAVEDLEEAVRDRDPADPHVAWLQSLIGPKNDLHGPTATQRTDVSRAVRRWMMGLEDRGTSTHWRLGFRLAEPVDSDLVPEFAAPSDSVQWQLSFHLRSADRPEIVVDAEDVWVLSRDSATIEGLQLDSPHELLLKEIGRAARIYPRLDKVLSEAEPSSVMLTSKQAYDFLREQRPVLVEQGFWVEVPTWWDSPSVRIGARLQLSSPPVEEIQELVPGAVNRPKLGLSTLIDHRWQISLGDVSLTLQEFEQLAGMKSPLLRVGGRWVEVRPEDIKAAVKFLQDHPEGKMSVLQAMRIAYAEADEAPIPILGVDAQGWVAAIFGEDRESEPLPELTQPKGFEGTLRPYQVRGLSWLAFLERFGLGPCLADDMGLGKTIQLLALLAHEREVNEEHKASGVEMGPVEPTLLIVPMSVLGNWLHESRRFCPRLRITLHHGPERATGDNFVKMAHESDAVITTYALAHRDYDTITRVSWGRVVLDEAQFIKNPAAKQSRSVRSIEADRRITLTGTPVENRLSELWSIMDFLNPGYLGPAQGFRRKFAVPIERYRDQDKRRRLRGLIQPFILRRLKTDPDVISDLPDKIETREYAHLTHEQAELYEACVNRMLGEIEGAEGVHRRGLVLAALIRLKQICNHPAQALKDHDPDSPTPPDHTRSGKCERILDMIEEVVAGGEQALVFSQFRQMGRLLVPMIRERINKEILFLHGGTPQQQRERIVARFQAAEGDAPVLMMSLKAGGVGLNLTAATHVFHFDRWWNPAVENQATDRAYRIGQTKTVEVHKFVVSGTLEERIDEMIEKKTELAEQIIGSGEQWLTELDSKQLRELLTLRRDAVGDD